MLWRRVMWGNANGKLPIHSARALKGMRHDLSNTRIDCLNLKASTFVSFAALCCPVYVKALETGLHRRLSPLRPGLSCQSTWCTK